MPRNKQYIITFPQLETRQVISLCCDLQNTLFFDVNGREIGYHNHHTSTMIWTLGDEDLYEEIKELSRFKHENINFIPSEKRNWGHKINFIYPRT